MRILLIGNGAREHAIAWKLIQSPLITELYVAPGNPGTASLAKTQNISIPAEDITALAEFAVKKAIDLTVVGPEKPLADGVVDHFSQLRLRIFGPTQSAAQLEASKHFAKTVMFEAQVPTARHEVIRSFEEGSEILNKFDFPVVLKADGLAAGKGVAICNHRNEADEALHQMMVVRTFGSAGSIVVAEEFLTGEEVSYLVIANGEDFVPLAAAQDHKRLLDNDQGPNTGGMGAYSPAPIFDSALQKNVEETIIQPILATMKRKGIPFTGVLYTGLMLTAQGPKVLEFNTRFGDPETQVILPRMESDLVELLVHACDGTLKGQVARWRNDPCITVVLASDGYPMSPKTGQIISGLERMPVDVMAFHAGTKREGSRIITAGGRVLAITALGKSFREAASKAYHGADFIEYPGKVLRKDIGHRVIK